MKGIWHQEARSRQPQGHGLAPPGAQRGEEVGGSPPTEAHMGGPHGRPTSEGEAGAGHTNRGISPPLTHSANIWPPQVCRLTSFHQFWIVPRQLSLRTIPPPRALGDSVRDSRQTCREPSRSLVLLSLPLFPSRRPCCARLRGSGSFPLKPAVLPSPASPPCEHFQA